MKAAWGTLSSWERPSSGPHPVELPREFAPQVRGRVEEVKARKKNAESTRASSVVTGGHGSESEFREV